MPAFAVLFVALGALAVACSSADSDGGADEGDGSGQATTEVGAEENADEFSPDEEDPDDAEDSEVAPVVTGPGTLVWAHDVEPPDLHLDDPVNGLPITSWIREGLLESLFGVDADLNHYPELLVEEPTLTANDDKTVVIEYRLRDALQWSDGTALTATDVEYTHNIMIEGCTKEPDGSILDGVPDGCVYLMADRRGLDLVTDFIVVSDTRFRVTMAAFYPDWRSLYRHVYAAHAFGADAAAVNVNLRTMRVGSRPLPSSGPLVFDRWDRGRSMILARNDNYHGSTSPDAQNPGPALIDEVRIDFMPTPQVLVDVVSVGSAHLVMTTTRAELEPLAAADDFTVDVRPGVLYEHWGLNLLNRHLAKPEVRQAIGHAIDKVALNRQVFEPLVGSLAEELGLGNAYWMPVQEPYEDHQAAYAGANLEPAAAALEAAGYTRGSDGVYRHPIDGRLTLRVGTTGGNTLREEVQTVLGEQLAEAGIEIQIDNVSGGQYFRERPFAPEALAASASTGAEGDADIWDITQFARAGGAWPGGQSGAFRSGVSSNPYGFSNPEFDTLASECDATVDDNERADCYNQLDLFVTTTERAADGMFIIPLGLRPAFFGFVPSRLAAVAVAPDTSAGGPLVNVVDYERR